MRGLLTIIFLVSATWIFSQELSYKQFTVKDGLPGSTVYHAVQDHEGFIWFATNQGVSRFDGRTFKNYTKEDGLPDNEILKLFVDKHNNVWFVSMVGTVSVWTEGRIRRFEESRGIAAIAEDPVLDSIYLIQGAGENYFGYHAALNKSGQWKFASYIKELLHLEHFFGWPILRASSMQGLRFYFTIVKKGTIQISIGSEHKNMYEFKVNPLQSLTPFTRQSFFDLSKNRKSIIFYSPDSVYHADEKGMSKILSLKDIGLNLQKDNDVSSIFFENDSIFWLCTRTQGLIKVDDFQEGGRSIKNFFQNSFCTSILKDKEGGYWVTTHNDGVYYLPNLEFYFIDNPGPSTKDVKCIRAIDNNKLVAGFADGSILQINAKTLKEDLYVEWAEKNKNNRVLELLYNSNRLYVATDRGVYNIQQGLDPTRMNTLASKGIYIDHDNNLVTAAAENVELRKNHQEFKLLFSYRSTCINGIGNTYYWGTLNGMYQWSHDSIRFLGMSFPQLSGIINHIDVAPDSSLWISTQQGIFILKNNSIYGIKKENGLSSNMCKNILLDEQVAWVSTDRGISRIDYKWRGEKLNYLVSNITEEDGLISNDVSQSALCNGLIWVATSRGISYFPRQYVSHSEWHPLININKIGNGNKEIFNTDTVYLDREQSKLSIELSGISYRSGKQIFYEYRLSNKDEKWTRVANNTIEFAALPFGQFDFEVRAIDRWGKTTVEPEKLTIFNDAPFYKTTWFAILSYVLTALIIGSFVFLISRNHQRKRDKEYQLKKKMADLEMMALRAQMDPHFIFNCLSSIQHHVLRADPLSANVYLHKFSTLIRKILQRSSNQTILLSEEMSIIRLYLELEKLRLEDRLEYKINYPEIMQLEDIRIPSMIIQPFVENAIKHGITPLKNETGQLLIDLFQHGDEVHCRIEDNGIGINTSTAHKPISGIYPSMGMSITKNRIHAMNSIQERQISFSVTDKQDLQTQGKGTIVELSFISTNKE